MVDNADGTQPRVGESLPGAALRLLRRLGINDLSELLPGEAWRPCIAHASKWYAPEWSYRDAMRNPDGGGWHLNRAAFNQALRDRASSAGARFVTALVDGLQQQKDGSYVVKLKNKAPGVPSELQATTLVDATGRNSVIGRQLGAQRQRLHEQWAAYTWITPPVEDQDDTTRTLSTSEGWWYSARLPENKRVIVYHGTAQDVPLLVRNHHDFLQQLNATDLLPYDVTTELCPTAIQATDAGVSTLQPFTGQHWMAIGDAAFGMDPIASQGMFFALYSGVRGAEALLKNRVNLYEEQIKQVVQAHLQARMVYYPGQVTLD